jgi:predicted ATPase
MYTENVVDFVLLKIRKLSPSARELAQIASCLGNRFDLATLVTASQLTTEEVELRLVECIDAGFITEVRGPEQLSPEFYASKSTKYGSVRELKRQENTPLITGIRTLISSTEFSTNKVFKYENFYFIFCDYY